LLKFPEERNLLGRNLLGRNLLGRNLPKIGSFDCDACGWCWTSRREAGRPRLSCSPACLPLTLLPSRSLRSCRKRWTIERAFQELSDHLEAEIETLGYPKAALFGFAVGFVSYNVLSVLKSALASVYGRESVEEEVSGYYIAGEISKTHEGLMIALPPERWAEAAAMPLPETADLLRGIAENANLDQYQKHPRGPKKPPPKRTKSKHKPHVSTAKLLAQRKEVS
jgi:hypothetical protein